MNVRPDLSIWQHGMSTSRTVPVRIKRAPFESRWVFCLTQLDGWRRVAVMALGLPRAAIQSGVAAFARADPRLPSGLPPPYRTATSVGTLGRGGGR